VIECLQEDALLVFNVINSIFPNSELLACLSCAHPHNVVAELFLGSLSASISLSINGVLLSISELLTPLDLLISLTDFVDDPILIVDEFVLVSQVGIHEPLLHSSTHHEVLSFCENPSPVLMGIYFSFHVEANGIVSLPHALKLQSISHVIRTLDVSVVLE
jgi:hypothetical protein